MGYTYRGQTHKGGNRNTAEGNTRGLHNGGTDTQGGLTEGEWTLKGDVKIVGGDGHTKDLYLGTEIRIEL